MHWTRKSEQSQAYCAVHNYQCPVHGHPGDPFVLDVAPSLIPGAWVCPEAVLEISEFQREAEERIEENEEPLPDYLDDVVIEALQMDGRTEVADHVRRSGVSSLDFVEIEDAITALEENQDVLPVQAEEAYERLLEVAE